LNGFDIAFFNFTEGFVYLKRLQSKPKEFEFFLTEIRLFEAGGTIP